MMILFLFLAAFPIAVNSDAAEDIGAIKSVLTVIFSQYKTEMTTLASNLDSVQTRLDDLERNVSARLHKLEDFLSRTQRDIPSKTGDSSNSAGSDFAVRLEKLEELTKWRAARTCQELKSMGVKNSGSYYLDPDGFGMGFKPVLMYCDMRSGTTRVDHDTIGKIRISSCHERGCFVHRVQYPNIPMGQIVSLMELSGHCEQHVRYDCLDAPLNLANVSLAWWTDRHDRTHTYWAGNGFNRSSHQGSTLNEGVCQCGLDAKCRSCRCDDVGTAGQWRMDEGHLTDRNQLPVIQLNFGEVDSRAGKMAHFQLGPLYCSGSAVTAASGASPESCRDLWISGVTQIGYYMVRATRARYPKVVFCDMSKEVGATGFERMFGSPGNLRYFAAFDVSLNKPFYDDFRYINFTSASVNNGGAFNIRDGIFHVPFSGTYLFSVHAMPVSGKPFMVQIHRNGVSVAILSNGETGMSMVGQSILLEVVVGDEIRLFNFGGDIFDDAATSDSFFHFVGVLLSSSDRE